ncbi:tryptophan--tRNA ligase [Jatrophihabitans cynanchi]|uniref:Tryptophan--tRNA ligase n=1 Tax=Jatrophihabitans cynanchi TaxID=2944128 RepID=A0ABY7JXN5_9ACTN|nr:tryptophan--tRNA ligase [Jatrophihabitans sp. SB3-54]WAX57063.1 tryptophan--tRNA ligase [Jatrophihabitans sp. SB3-54]
MSRILSGDRPTGALHLGHYFGTLANRVRLQQQGHELFVVVADYQVITDRATPGAVRDAVTSLVLDYLACGLDPDATVVFAHSAVPALNQLLLPFLSLVSVGELSRNPTVKQEARQSGRRAVSGLLLTYPVHQAADILFCKADLVPVGRDQLPHLEQTRSIARRFNERYGPVFGLPEALLGDAPVLLGLDGRKMSKSLGNAIALSDPPDVVAAKVRAARTDSERTISYEPERRPQVANLLRIAGLCSGTEPAALADEVGDGAGRLKALVTEAIVQFLRPLQDRRARFDAADVHDVLARGTAVANAVADRTLAHVHAAMGFAERRHTAIRTSSARSPGPR